MIKELIYEFAWAIILLIIIIVGVLLCMQENNRTILEDKYQNWKYNYNPSEGTGWIDSIVNKGE